MGDRRAEAGTPRKVAAAPPGKMAAPPTRAAPKSVVAPPATQTRAAGQGIIRVSGVGNDGSSAVGERGNGGSQGFAAATGEAAVPHSRSAVAGKNRDDSSSSSSRVVSCRNSDVAAASAATNRARSDSVLRRTGPAASFKRMVSLKDSKAPSCNAAAGADASCAPNKASPGSNPQLLRSSGAAAATGRITTGASSCHAAARADDPRSPQASPGRTKPSAAAASSSSSSATGRREKRTCQPLFEAPWLPPFHKQRKREPFSPRQKVQERLSVFREEVLKQRRLNEARPDLKAIHVLKQRGGVPTTKRPGAVPGVEVGDEFHYRSELIVAGLHSDEVRGIDYMGGENGKSVATCVISSRRYANIMEGRDVLEYCGEGGDAGGGGGDQKMERGNLALANNIDSKTPVRVVHGFPVPRDGTECLESSSNTATRYVYDGLYLVEKWWWDRAAATGFLVLKYRLRRMPGQPTLELTEVLRRRSRAGDQRRDKVAGDGKST